MILLASLLAGELHLHALDAFGRPVDASWTLEDGRTLQEGKNSLEVGDYRMAVTADGFFGETVAITVRDDHSSEVQAVLNASLVTLTWRRLVIHDTIHFELNQALIKPESYALLTMIARTLIEHPEVLKVRIEGHADERGSEEFNLDLSRRRAEAVRSFLVQVGISPERLVAVGYGESRPLEEESGERAWAANRRVEFHITERID